MADGLVVLTEPLPLGRGRGTFRGPDVSESEAAELERSLCPLGIAFVLLGFDRTIQCFSSTVQRHIRVVPADLGFPLLDPMHVLDFPDLDEAVRQTVELGASHARTVRSLDASDERISIRISRYELSEPCVLIAIVDVARVDELEALSESDVLVPATSRRNLEATVERQAAQIDQLLSLQDLAGSLNAELDETVDALKQSNNDLGDFTRVASHDLRSPLRGITTLVSMLWEDHPDMPTDIAGRLEQISNRALRMTTLLDDLLAYLASGSTRTQPEEVDLRSITEDIFDVLECNDGLVLEVDGGVRTAVVNRVSLTTVLRNLVDNAIKHSAGETDSVTVTFEQSDSDLLIDVTDSGPGIPEEYLERIFCPFETLQSRDNIEGTGLGLAIVQRALRQVGGVVTVTSTVGEGSTFRIKWPLNTKARTDEHAQTE